MARPPPGCPSHAPNRERKREREREGGRERKKENEGAQSPPSLRLAQVRQLHEEVTAASSSCCPTAGDEAEQNEAPQPRKQKKQRTLVAAAPAADGPPPAAMVGCGGEEAFSWKKAIKAQLRAAEGEQMPLKKLRAAVIAACQAHGGAPGAADRAELKAAFAKKLGKATGVEVVGETVRFKRGVT